MSFTKIVRPFQLRDTTPPRRIFDPNAPAKENSILSVGKGGSAKTVTGNVSGSARYYMKKKVKEKRKGSD